MSSLEETFCTNQKQLASASFFVFPGVLRCSKIAVSSFVCWTQPARFIWHVHMAALHEAENSSGLVVFHVHQHVACRVCRATMSQCHHPLILMVGSCAFFFFLFSFFNTSVWWQNVIIWHGGSQGGAAFWGICWDCVGKRASAVTEHKEELWSGACALCGGGKKYRKGIWEDCQVSAGCSWGQEGADHSSLSV